jgi:hypothetical protein
LLYERKKSCSFFPKIIKTNGHYHRPSTMYMGDAR